MLFALTKMAKKIFFFNIKLLLFIIYFSTH